MAHPERPWEVMGLVELQMPSVKSPILASFTASFLARDPILKPRKTHPNLIWPNWGRSAKVLMGWSGSWVVTGDSLCRKFNLTETLFWSPTTQLGTGCAGPGPLLSLHSVFSAARGMSWAQGHTQSLERLDDHLTGFSMHLRTQIDKHTPRCISDSSATCTELLRYTLKDCRKCGW